LGSRKNIKNRCEGSPEKKSLIGNSAEFENYAILNRESVKKFQKRDRMENRGDRVMTLAKQF